MATNIILTESMSDLDKSIFLARHINSTVDILRPLVYKVYKEELWRGRFDSFAEYIESPEGLGKSQGYVSKLKTVEEHYVIQGQIAPEKLSGIDFECLYLASKLPVSTEEQVEHARTLTRSELRQSKAEDDAHVPAFGEYCNVCWLSKQNHP